MFTKKNVSDFIVRAYNTAESKGFHDKELSVPHMMMLVLSEIGEIVEADRRNLHANLKGFDVCVGWTYNDRFKNYVKDTVEDELADVCIRLFDLCGAQLIKPTFSQSMQDDFQMLFKKNSLCERCFYLSAILCHCDGTGDARELADVIGSALQFIACMATDMGVDLIRHIELKMQYNETRANKHGKRY